MATRFCPRCETEYREGYTVCSDCGEELVTVDPAEARAVDDPWFLHFVRFWGAVIVVGLAAAFLVGWVWVAFIFSRTGYRKRDVLLSMIPVYGVVPYTVGLWRYTARGAYWTPRPERPSRPLSQASLRIMSITGWAIFVLAIAAVALGEDDAAVDQAAWRADFVDFWVGQGAEPVAARCAADRVAPGIPYESSSDLERAVVEGFEDCGSAVPGEATVGSGDERTPVAFYPVLRLESPEACGTAPEEGPVARPAADGSACYVMGPEELVVNRYSARLAPDSLESSDVVTVEMTIESDEDLASFNRLAGLCFDREEECPTGQLAVVFNGEVQSAPTVQARSFENQIHITGVAEDVVALLEQTENAR